MGFFNLMMHIFNNSYISNGNIFIKKAKWAITGSILDKQSIGVTW